MIQAFLAEHDSPDRSSSDGIYYEEDYWTKQYLRDFVERRKVDLGAMTGTRWRLQRLGRRIKGRYDRWSYTRREAREVRKLEKERELATSQSVDVRPPRGT